MSSSPHRFLQFLKNSWHVREISSSSIGDIPPCFCAETDSFQILCFHNRFPSWPQIKQFLHAHCTSVIILCKEDILDIYAQSALDPNPIVAHDVAWAKQPEFASLAECLSFPEFTFELDRRYGRRRLERQFVRDFRRFTEKLANSWTGLAAPYENQRWNLSLTTMLRLLFVTFLEARGILDHKTSFLHEMILHCEEKHLSIYRDFIQPLFFETLNRAKNRRTSRARALGNIPFLNGGLFTPTEWEQNSPELHAPNEIWCEIIFQLFEKYSLSAQHSQERKQLLLDPMMLGHVFEELMMHQKRSATGSYYTPMPLARQLVTDTFRHWFQQHYDINAEEFGKICMQQDLSCLSREKAENMENSLSEIAILDPAVGSGAFLQCALVFLHKIRTALRAHCQIETHSGQLARHILAKNLFGVDIIPMSGQICELRLWLELIQFFDPGEEIPPLPNLDMNILCGNSLTELSQYYQVLGLSSFPSPDPPGVHLKHRYKLATGYTKKKLASQIDAHLRASGKKMMQSLIEACEREYTECAKSPRCLFDNSHEPSKSQKHRMHILTMHKKKLQESIDNDSTPGFCFSLHFGDILSKGGFDIVISNPPWYSLHTLPRESQDVLRVFYQSARSAQGMRSQAADISALFIEKALHCIQPKGLITMLLPNKLFHAPSYANFRKLIQTQGHILQFTDWSNASFNAFTAATYPASISLMPSQGKEDVFLPCPEKEPPSSMPFLKEFFTIHKGLRTSANDVFITTPHPGVSQGKRGCCLCQFRGKDQPVPIENTLMHPILRGADIHAYEAIPQKNMIFTHDWKNPDRPLPDLPPHATEWFRENAEILLRREGALQKPLHTLFGCSSDLHAKKVVWKDIAYQMEACFVEDPRILPINTAYYIPVQSDEEGLLLTAYLNAKRTREYCRAHAEHARGDYRRYIGWLIENIPWPFANPNPKITSNRKKLISLSHQCHQTTKEKRFLLQTQIDEIVDQCFTLSTLSRPRRKQSILPGCAREIKKSAT